MNDMLTMLIVDDQPVDRTILKKIFENDFNVIEAENGRVALAMLQKGIDTDLVLLDLMMPEMDGFDFLNAMREDERFSDIPIIVNTEKHDPDNEERALALGAEDFISKPFDQRIVRHRVNKVIQNRIYTSGIAIQSLQELRYRSERDILTGLYNRESFYLRSREFLKEHDDNCIIGVWDLDRFKVVNELFGANKGDQVLSNLSREMRHFFGYEGICARFEGDQFYFCTTKEYFEKIDRDIEAFLAGEWSWSPIEYTLQLHMGLFEVTEDNRNMSLSLMCDHASLALQLIKENYITRSRYFSEDMKEAIINEQELVTEMEKALRDREFYVLLQPIVDTMTGRTISAEALIRWKHPVKGTISPGLFIPTFEKNGFIARLDLYVCEEVCRFQAKLKQANLPIVPISVNISRINFYKPEFGKQIREMIARYGISPELIKLEITEGAYEDNPKYMIDAIKDFKDSSFQILMDDFGSGYSSLNMLKDFNVDILKIDMKFINDLETSVRADNILFSILQMAKALNMETVAEGVETAAQYELLASMGCDSIQGYFFSKPIEMEDFKDRLLLETDVDFSIELPDVRRTILIVDDQPIDRQIIKTMLSDQYHILEADNGEAALDMLKMHFKDISLVISDIHMPKINGLELLENMSNAIFLKDIPVIMVTAHGERENEELALSRGALEIITKPYDAALARKRIENILKISEVENPVMRFRNFS